MARSDVIPCPRCPRRLSVPETAWGQLVQCPACGAQFVATADGQAEPELLVALPVEEPAPPPALLHPEPFSAASSLDFQSMPDHVRPHRGIVILLVGIFSVALCWLPLLSWFLGPFALILGGLATSMGTSDLMAMSRGHMDRVGRDLTSAGKILGTIGMIATFFLYILTCLVFMAHF